MLIQTRKASPEFEAEVRRLQRLCRENRPIPSVAKPFDVDEWLATTPPATEQELAEMEEFLRERNEEREAELAREAGIAP